MPYPVPEGDPDVDALRWFLVAVPDDPAFIAAALGMFTEGGSSYLWGKEGIEEKSEPAAQSWARAANATLEALEMGFPDILLSYIDEVEDLLRALQATACCIDMDPTGGDQFTQADFNDSGPFPQELVDAGFLASTTDTAGWQDYKCLISNAFVDAIQNWLRKMAPLVDAAGLLIGGIAVLAGILSFVYVPVGVTAAAIAFRIFMSAGAVATVWRYLAQGSSYGLEVLADDLEVNRADLVCALYGGDGVDASIASFRSTVRGLLPFPVDELVVALGDPSVLKSFYGGRYDQEDVAAQFADKGYEGEYDCGLCGTPATFASWTFDNDNEGWYYGASNPAIWVSDDGYPDFGCANVGTAGSQRVYHSPPFFVAGGTGDIKVSLWHRRAGGINWIAGFALINVGGLSYGLTPVPQDTSWTHYEDTVSASFPEGSYQLRLVVSGLAAPRFDTVTVEDVTP